MHSSEDVTRVTWGHGRPNTRGGAMFWEGHLNASALRNLPRLHWQSQRLTGWRNDAVLPCHGKRTRPRHDQIHDCCQRVTGQKDGSKISQECLIHSYLEYINTKKNNSNFSIWYMAIYNVKCILIFQVFNTVKII